MICSTLHCVQGRFITPEAMEANCDGPFGLFERFGPFESFWPVGPLGTVGVEKPKPIWCCNESDYSTTTCTSHSHSGYIDFALRGSRVKCETRWSMSIQKPANVKRRSRVRCEAACSMSIIIYIYRYIYIYTYGPRTALHTAPKLPTGRNLMHVHNNI